MRNREAPAAVDGRSAPAARRVVSSAELFARAREVVILHGPDEYRLRITRAGKLILTK